MQILLHPQNPSLHYFHTDKAYAVTGDAVFKMLSAVVRFLFSEYLKIKLSLLRHTSAYVSSIDLPAVTLSWFVRAQMTCQHMSLFCAHCMALVCLHNRLVNL